MINATDAQLGLLAARRADVIHSWEMYADGYHVHTTRGTTILLADDAAVLTWLTVTA